MSAVYEDVKNRAVRRQERDFTTMHGEPVAAIIPEYSSSSLAQNIGSAFITGAVVLYALHGEPNDFGDRTKILPIRSGQIFPLAGETLTSTMSLGGAWVDFEPDVYTGGVVNLPWTRKVIFSGAVHLKTAQLPRRAPRAIVGDFLSDEENG